MPTNSALGGPILPDVAPAPLEGDALYDFFHDWICSLTGLDNSLVRPRWQREPGNLPEENVTWLAFGITKRPSDTYIAEVHVPIGAGYNETRRHETLSFLISCYGPDSEAVLQLFRDDIQVAQNREVLSLQSMGLIESGEILIIPELIKDKWVHRADLTFDIRRQVLRQYQVQSIVTSDITVNNKHYLTNIKA